MEEGPRMQGTTAAQDTARRLKHRLRDQLKWLRLRIVGHALLDDMR